ncbi:MAG: ABC transporter ATP-binding protein [Alphaproteobacteria bacterium]|nr:ABC transporter ATP-binding protein [Alphaproteobacteria bacterium]MCW5741709.1 ABC transporter ATP-binding protein [Alphaproteobacteria bacterium]
MSGTSGVSVEHVTFGYGGTPVLDDVSLEIEAGEFFAFLGPSGSGKTTLLRLVAGFGTPGAGRIRVGARDITDLPPWSRNVGMVFQNYALWPHMTVAENVAFGLEMRKVGRAERDKRVAEALAMVGLDRLAARRPAQLSGGQQQRVALARTLVIQPEVLLLDEPLSNLDAKLRVEMRAELVSLQRKTGLTTIYVTHDQEEANATAHRMAVLDGGRIQQIGAPLELYDRPANRFVAGFLGAANLLEGEVAGSSFRHASGLVFDLADRLPQARPVLMVRPQNLTLAAAPSGTGVVRHREHLGAVLRYDVEAAGTRLVAECPYRAGEPVFAEGDRVALGVRPGGGVLLPP